MSSIETTHEEIPIGAPPMPDTDGADAITVLAILRFCAASWVPDARIVGNIRAGDIVKALDEVLPQLPAVKHFAESES